jgi:hypothetical protein
MSGSFAANTKIADIGKTSKKLTSFILKYIVFAFSGCNGWQANLSLLLHSDKTVQESAEGGSKVQ